MLNHRDVFRGADLRHAKSAANPPKPKTSAPRAILPVSAEWNDRSKSLIESRFQDDWSLEEFIEARKRWHRMIKSVDYRVPILLDFSESHEAPAGALRYLCAIHRTPHPRQGHIYITGLTPPYEKFAPFLLDGAADPAKAARLVDSIDEAVIPQ